ncbi:hypothetical protein NKF27_15045 [Halomonas sp. DN3]|nr:hypothetical protein NKF27_15045 [Halomonas sp. DN3]
MLTQSSWCTLWVSANARVTRDGLLDGLPDIDDAVVAAQPMLRLLGRQQIAHALRARAWRVVDMHMLRRHAFTLEASQGVVEHMHLTDTELLLEQRLDGWRVQAVARLGVAYIHSKLGRIEKQQALGREAWRSSAQILQADALAIMLRLNAPTGLAVRVHLDQQTFRAIELIIDERQAGKDGR